MDWISVNDRLPKLYTPVLVYIGEDGTFPKVREGRRLLGGTWIADLIRDEDEITHWMPMPEGPDEA